LLNPSPINLPNLIGIAAELNPQQVNENDHVTDLLLVRSVPSSTLHAQVLTASGLTALAYCSRCASFVGLGLITQRLRQSWTRMIKIAKQDSTRTRADMFRALR
jgi:hypothetical protein